MAIKDILLTLTSYPDPTPVSVIDQAVSAAAALGAHLAAIACEVHVEVPGHFLSGSIASIPAIIAGEEARKTLPLTAIRIATGTVFVITGAVIGFSALRLI